MKCDCLIFLITILNIFYYINPIKQMRYSNGYRYVSPFSANSYIVI